MSDVECGPVAANDLLLSFGVVGLLVGSARKIALSRASNPLDVVSSE